jgi:hypothetical protein
MGVSRRRTSFTLGLAPTFQLAKRDAQIEGCCGGGLDPPSCRRTGTFTSRTQVLRDQVHEQPVMPAGTVDIALVSAHDPDRPEAH